MKKGSIDYLMIPLFLFVIGIAVMLGTILLVQFYQEAQLPMAEAINMTQESFDMTVTVMDFIVPIVLVGLGISIVVVSFTIQSHPIFFIVGIFTSGTGIILSAVVSNTMVETTNLTQTYMGSALGITNQIFQYLPYIVLPILAVALIIFYGKASGGATGGV